MIVIITTIIRVSILLFLSPLQVAATACSLRETAATMKKYAISNVILSDSERSILYTGALKKSTRLYV